MSKNKTASAVTNDRVPIDLIDPHPRNYNQHPPEEIFGLRISIRQFGQVQSVVVQKKPDGRYVFVAGHGVGEASRLEGLRELDARVIPEDWPPEKVLAYLAADNEHARRSQRDDAQLASILQEVRDFDRTLLQATSYTDDEFAALLDEVGTGEGGVQLKEVEVKPPPDMAWVLIGMPLVEFGSIAPTIENIAQIPSAMVVTTVNNEKGQRP